MSHQPASATIGHPPDLLNSGATLEEIIHKVRGREKADTLPRYVERTRPPGLACEASTKPSVGLCHIFFRHCEERSDVAIHLAELTHGILRYARNDAE
ncbi:hypothetical protein [Pelodictyon luteolum]|nr:hypothetical protein [Pelodictyon luteolum]